MQQLQTGFVETNGTQLYYEMMGEGHPLVLIHGGYMDRRMWDDQFAVMLRKYRKLVIPHAPVHVAPVNKHKLMALAHHFIIKLRAIRLDKACFRSIRLS